MRIYLSGALAAAPDVLAACALYEAIAGQLEAHGHEAYVPHLVTGPGHAFLSPANVFAVDVDALLASEAVLAVLDNPSHGVGAEVAYALSNGIPVLGAVQLGRPISRFLQGMLEVHPAGLCVEYSSVDDLAEQTALWAERIRPSPGFSRIAMTDPGAANLVQNSASGTGSPCSNWCDA